MRWRSREQIKIFEEKTNNVKSSSNFDEGSQKVYSWKS